MPILYENKHINYYQYNMKKIDYIIIDLLNNFEAVIN